jgi:geranylgeranyl reductase family protein
MEAYDVAVIGGGPAGLSTATSASKLHVDTILFEEHESIGLPWHCAGIVSSNRLRSLHIDGVEEAILARFDTVDVYLSLRHAFSIRSITPQLVLDRVAFDRLLAEKASSLGVELRLGSRVKSLRYKPGGLIDVDAGSDGCRCRVAVLAEGLPGVLAGKLGFDVRRLKPLPSIQYLVHVDPSSLPRAVEVHLLPAVSPPFFLWVIPIDESLCRVGLASGDAKKLKLLIEGFLSKRFKSWRMLSESRWAIPVGGPLHRTVGERILLVGDVAGQVKPTTGGGIISSIVCGMIAGKVSALASIENDYTLLDKYEALWRRFFGFNFKIQRIVRGVVDRASWRILSSVVESISMEYGVLEVADLDTQIDLIFKLASSPNLVSRVARSFASALA